MLLMPMTVARQETVQNQTKTEILQAKIQMMNQRKMLR